MSSNDKARITVKSRFDYDAGDTVNIYEGVHYVIDDKRVVRYSETVPGTDYRINTKIVVTEDSVVISKSGATISEMRFAEGYSHSTRYIIPEGELIIRTDTKEIDIDIAEKLISANLKYDIFHADTLSGEGNVSVKIEIE